MLTETNGNLVYFLRRCGNYYTQTAVSIDSETMRTIEPGATTFVAFVYACGCLEQGTVSNRSEYTAYWTKTEGFFPHIKCGMHRSFDRMTTEKKEPE